MHEKLGHRVAVQHDGQDALHSVDLALVRALLELQAQIGEGRDVGGIVLVDETIGIFQEGRHGDGWWVTASGWW